MQTESILIIARELGERMGSDFLRKCRVFFWNDEKVLKVETLNVNTLNATEWLKKKKKRKERKKEREKGR
jgi:hypothetical protein